MKPRLHLIDWLCIAFIGAALTLIFWWAIFAG